MGLQSDFLSFYLERQLELSFPDQVDFDGLLLRESIDKALEKLRISFKVINNKYYEGSFPDSFNYLNSDHYCMYLYWVSRMSYEISGDELLSTKIFYLNKKLHSVDLFFKVKLPDVFLLVHALGTILGNADYDDYLVVYQGCTVGSKTQGLYPKLGKNVVLYSNSSLLGNCQIGSNVTVAANTLLVDCNVPDNTLVTGLFPNNSFKQLRASASNYFLKS